MKREHKPKGNTYQKMNRFDQKVAELLTMGGSEKVRKQHDLGKLTARERLQILFD